MAYYRQCSYYRTDRYSESSAHMPAIPFQLTVVPCRSGCASLLTLRFTNDCHATILPQMWVYLKCVLPGAGHWLDSLGFIMYVLWNWIYVVVSAMLGGELCACEISLILTQWLKHVPSHHPHSVACYVSTVQKDLDISHCRLPSCQHFQWSGRCDDKHEYFRGYA
jgi:hypothetical protein